VVDVAEPSTPKTDVSELTLVRGDHTIVLVRDQLCKEIELTAHFVLLFDNSKYQAKKDEFITVDEVRYQVIEIDTNGDRVVLRQENDAEKTVVVRRLEASR